MSSEKKKPIRDSGTTTASAAPTAPEADSRPVSEADGQPAPPWALGRAELDDTPASVRSEPQVTRQGMAAPQVSHGVGGAAGAGAIRANAPLSPVAELSANEPWADQDAYPTERHEQGGLSVVGPEGAHFPGESSETKPWGWQWRKGDQGTGHGAT
jgi:hypothetical protein